MNQNLTEIVFILDRSGSMEHLVRDTIGGFNSFVEQQRKEEGKALLTTVLFDDRYEILHNGVDIQDVPKLTDEDYYARGLTAMFDAIGKTINDVGDRLAKTSEDDRPGKVVFVITTDGQENASKEFSQKQVREMIERQQSKYNWKFLFLGANIDAFTEANKLGIGQDFAANYTASSVGTKSLYSSVSKGVTSVRNSVDGMVSSDWSSGIK